MADPPPPATYTNIHGRKATRGLRPWLLIPKVLAVGVYFGGLVTSAAVWLMPWPDRGHPTPAVDDSSALLARVELVGRLFRFVIVPALLIAMLFGVLLLLQHPRTLLRLRWLRLKLAILALTVPAAHLFMSSRLHLIRQTIIMSAPRDSSQATAGISTQFTAAMLTMIALSALLIVLGRQKPRLGQNWARDYRH